MDKYLLSLFCLHRRQLAFIDNVPHRPGRQAQDAGSLFDGKFSPPHQPINSSIYRHLVLSQGPRFRQ